MEIRWSESDKISHINKQRKRKTISDILQVLLKKSLVIELLVCWS